MDPGARRMTRNPNEIEQAVSRTLRESLEKLQRTAEDLNHAVNDLVSACASTRPSNSLPPMLRAQSAAASLAASLEVLSRFVTAALQPELRTPAEQQAVESAESSAQVISESLLESQPEETVPELQASKMVEEGAPVVEALEPPPSADSDTLVDVELPPEAVPVPAPVPEDAPEFDIAALPQNQREMHRRADRVAKVAMQDIKMLRPDQVKQGKEHKDLCLRLHDDIEKARREYDRRFHAILDQPVDYFYKRMVEILGDGNAETLGEYPYPSPVLRR
jgi:hypothetical protein